MKRGVVVIALLLLLVPAATALYAAPSFASKSACPAQKSVVICVEDRGREVLCNKPFAQCSRTFRRCRIVRAALPTPSITQKPDNVIYSTPGSRVASQRAIVGFNPQPEPPAIPQYIPITGGVLYSSTYKPVATSRSAINCARVDCRHSVYGQKAYPKYSNGKWVCVCPGVRSGFRTVLQTSGSENTRGRTYRWYRPQP